VTGSLQPALVVPTSEDLLSILVVSRPAQAAAALVAVVEHEDRLAADNLLAPYADRLPPVLTTATADRVADALSGLSGPLMHRILFGNFRRVPGSVLQTIMNRLPEEASADLLTALAWGYDGPRLAAELIGGAAAPPMAALRRLEPVVAARLLGLLHRDPPSAVFQTVRSEAVRSEATKLGGRQCERRPCRRSSSSWRPILLALSSRRMAERGPIPATWPSVSSPAGGQMARIPRC